MKQEQRFVAELYRYLAPFIDAREAIYISLDGQAARTATAGGRFEDANIPDLWFTLIGANHPVRIEAKILGDSGRALLMRSQLQAWSSNGSGAYKPQAWVASNRAFDSFFYWSHTDFVETLDRCGGSQNVHLRPPICLQRFDSISELALHVLRAHA